MSALSRRRFLQGAGAVVATAALGGAPAMARRRRPNVVVILADLLKLVAGTRANLLSLEHLREAVPLNVRETGVELTLETRGPEHARLVTRARQLS